VTGFQLDGCCKTGAKDNGTHTACRRRTKDFFNFTKFKGHGISSPRPESRFPGCKADDYWCLSVLRRLEAQIMGNTSFMRMEVAQNKSLVCVPLAPLLSHQIQKENAA